MAGEELRPEADAVERRRQAAGETGQRGPGTAGYTTSGAAYRGMEIAAATGRPSPADPGFPAERVGLHPGQGVEGDSTTTQRSADLEGQKLNQAAHPAGRTAVEMLVSPVEGETPENRA
ncbi:MAG: hypothetical protein ACOY93_11475 [Bacillota bacterium]